MLGEAIARRSPQVSASYLEAELRVERPGADLAAARRAAEASAKQREDEDRRWGIGAASGLERWRSTQQQLASAIAAAAAADQTHCTLDQLRAMHARIDFQLRVLRVDVGRTELQPQRAALRKADARLRDAKAEILEARKAPAREAARARSKQCEMRVRDLRRRVEEDAKLIQRDEKRARALEKQLKLADDGMAPRWLDFEEEETPAQGSLTAEGSSMVGAASSPMSRSTREAELGRSPSDVLSDSTPHRSSSPVTPATVARV